MGIDRPAGRHGEWQLHSAHCRRSVWPVGGIGEGRSGAVHPIVAESYGWGDGVVGQDSGVDLSICGLAVRLTATDRD